MKCQHSLTFEHLNSLSHLSVIIWGKRPRQEASMSLKLSFSITCYNLIKRIGKRADWAGLLRVAVDFSEVNSEIIPPRGGFCLLKWWQRPVSLENCSLVAPNVAIFYCSIRLDWIMPKRTHFGPLFECQWSQNGRVLWYTCCFSVVLDNNWDCLLN